ncbi:MAG: transcription termination/antitermination protein NusG [bacterium]|nr:transcription termination/antitermination protein NusG [bacterium]
MAKWYVLQAFSGQEQRVKEHLEERVRLYEMSERIRQVLIPTQTVQDIRGGKKKIYTRKFYPGYVLVEMDLDDETWQLVKKTPGVIGFLGGEQPAPLSEEEVVEMFRQVEAAKDRIAPRVTYAKGDRVKINDGPFINFIGIVEEVDEERGKLGVSVSVFGRTTPVELEYWQVEKDESA